MFLFFLGEVSRDRCGLTKSSGKIVVTAVHQRALESVASAPCLIVVEVQLLQPSGVAQTVRHAGHTFVSDRIISEVQGRNNAGLQGRRLRQGGRNIRQTYADKHVVRK